MSRPRKKRRRGRSRPKPKCDAWDLELAERRLREGDSDAALRILQAVLATLGEPDARREVEQRIKAILSGGR